MATNIPDPADWSWGYEVRENVGIWDLRAWSDVSREELESVTRHYEAVADGDDVEGTIGILSDDADLGSDTQAYMEERWSEAAQAVDVGRIAFVSDGIAGMVATSNVDAPDSEVDHFGSVEEAIEWLTD